jgi:uncharacterized membrane protein YdcZ (DUF606 family)
LRGDWVVTIAGFSCGVFLVTLVEYLYAETISSIVCAALVSLFLAAGLVIDFIRIRLHR